MAWFCLRLTPPYACAALTDTRLSQTRDSDSYVTLNFTVGISRTIIPRPALSTRFSTRITPHFAHYHYS